MRMLTVALILAVISPTVLGEPPNLAAALSMLSKKGKTSTTELIDAVRLIQRAAEPGDSKVLSVLFSCVKDEALQAPVRSEALRASLKLLTTNQSSELFIVLREITQEIVRTKAAATAGQSSSYYAAASLVAVFMESLPPKVPWTSEPLLSLLRDWSILDFNEWHWGWLGPKAFEAIATDRADAALRQRFLLEVMNAVSFFQPIGEAAKLLCEPTTQAPLRSMFTQALKDASGFHYGAASILARAGDQEILTTLKTRVEEGRTNPTLDTDTIRHYVWQIEVQHPPKGLLDFIQSPTQLNSDAREWAIERALELKVKREEIRDALVAHCTRYTNPADKTWMAMRPRLISVATRTGVLTQDEIHLLPVANEMPPSPHEHSHDPRQRR